VKAAPLTAAEACELRFLAALLGRARLAGLPADLADQVRRMAVLAARVDGPHPAGEPSAAARRLTTAQVAVAAGVTVAEVRAAIGSGELPAVRDASRWHVTQQAAGAYAAARRSAAARCVPAGLKAS
jgi:hypothetical protein